MAVTILPDIRKRIVNAKWVLEKAARTQNGTNEMDLAVSLLLMHDAVELLMLAVLDHLQVSIKKKRDFMDFWPDLKQAGHPEPPDHLAMESLNKLRVGLKHSGNLPHPQAVRDLMPRVRGFFENVLATYCDLAYAGVSLVDLVHNTEARTLLLDAQNLFASGNKEEAVTKLRIAFDKLEQALDQNRFLKAPRQPGLPSDLARTNIEREFLRPLFKFLDQCAHRTNLLALGIDPFRYSDFVQRTPDIVWTVDGTPHVHHWHMYESVTPDIFSDMVNFVVDYSIKTSSDA